MSVCRDCKMRDDTPSSARRITKGQSCSRCGISYVAERAALSDAADLTDFDGESGETENADNDRCNEDNP